MFRIHMVGVGRDSSKFVTTDNVIMLTNIIFSDFGMDFPDVFKYIHVSTWSYRNEYNYDRSHGNPLQEVYLLHFQHGISYKQNTILLQINEIYCQKKFGKQ
jgi:hypothetical protein